MRPQQYARRDPYPRVPFNVVRRMTGQRRIRLLIEDITYGAVVGLALAFVLFEFLA